MAVVLFAADTSDPRRVCGTGAACAVRLDSVPMVVCSEAIEHIKDDIAALREITRILGRGGELILTVPAHSYYFSYDDRFVRHWRRYNIRELVNTLSGLGFTDVRIVRVTGPLEKLTTMFAVMLFRVARRVVPVNAQKSSFSRRFFRAFMPIYKKANDLYALIMKCEVKLIPRSLATIVLIHCRKQSA
jgi:hypothetical protein